MFTAPHEQLTSYDINQSACVPVGRILCMVVRDSVWRYMTPANRILEPKARNAAKLSTPSRTNAPTVRAKAETAT